MTRRATWLGSVGLAVLLTPVFKFMFAAAHSPLPWGAAFLVSLMLTWMTWTLVVKPPTDDL
jgi:hypothetical protein